LKAANKLFEDVTKFGGGNRSDLHSEKKKCTLNLGSVCYHSLQNLLSSLLLCNNLSIKRYRTVILPDFYGHETCSLILKEQHRLRVFGNRVLGRVFYCKRKEGRKE
jgi:hypothetical protein